MKVLTLTLGLGLLLAALACAAPPASPPPTPVYLPTVTPTRPAAVIVPPAAAATPAAHAQTPAARPAAANPPDTGEPRRAIFDNEDERHHGELGRAAGRTIWGCSGGTGADTSDPLEGLDSYEYDRPSESQLRCAAKARRQWRAQRR